MHSGPRWILPVLALFSVSSAWGGSVLPLIDGSLAGDLFPFGQTKRGIHWTGTLATADTGDRTFSVVLTGPGLKGRADAAVKSTDGSGTWKIRETEVDLAQWFEAVGVRYFPDLTPFQTAGIVAVSGEGATSSSGPVGSLHFELSAGSLTDESGAWSLHDLAGRLECPDFPAWTSSTLQRLVFGELKAGELSLKNGELNYQIESGGRIHVLSIHGEMFGGTFSCGEFRVDSTNSPIEVLVQARGVDLGALRSYLPKAVAEAHGRVDAELRVSWSAETGFKYGHGAVQLHAGESASIRLAPSPGFLTSQVPTKINLAPAWFERIGLAFNQAFPARETLLAIENGEQSLIVESIEGQLQPGDTDNDDATVVLHLVTHPTKTDRVKKVRLNINLSGPLSTVLGYALNQHVSFGF